VLLKPGGLTLALPFAQADCCPLAVVGISDAHPIFVRKRPGFGHLLSLLYKSRLNEFRAHAIIRTSLSDGIGSCHAFLLTVEFRQQTKLPKIRVWKSSRKDSVSKRTDLLKKVSMIEVNPLLFFTSLMAKPPHHLLIAVVMTLSIAGLALLALNPSTVWMYVGLSLIFAGIGVMIPLIAFLGAGTLQRKLGATMGRLAAASAPLGRTLGSAAGGWLFSAMHQLGFAWLILPMPATLILLFLRPSWWAASMTPAHITLTIL
jgi:hypothetical protein